MKTSSLIILTTLALFHGLRAEDPTVNSIQDNINQGIKDKNKEILDKYNDDLVAFQQGVEDAVTSHQSAVRVVKVGKFIIKIQENCEIDFPKRPEKPTITEKECAKAHFDAETTATLISKATPLNPPNVRMVMSALNTCELEVSWIKEFEIYNNCWGAEIPAMYKPIFDAQKESLEAQGYEEVVDAESGKSKWVKQGETQRLTLDEVRNKKIDA